MLFSGFSSPLTQIWPLADTVHFKGFHLLAYKSAGIASKRFVFLLFSSFNATIQIH